MRNVEVRINGQVIDTYENTSSPIAFRRRAEVLTDLTKRDGDTTIQFALPKTANNRKFFGAISDLQAYAKFYTAYPFNVDMVSSGVYIVRNGRLTIEEITKNEYKCRIVATNINWANAFRERTLRDIQSLRRIAFTGLDTVIAVTDEQALDIDSHSAISDVCFPLCFYAPPFVPNVWAAGNYISREYYAPAAVVLPAGKEIFGKNIYFLGISGNAHFTFYDYPPAVYLVAIIRGLFADIGYAVTGTILDDPEFRKLVLPYTGEGRVGWNWGTMANVNITSDGSTKGSFQKIDSTYQGQTIGLYDYLYFNLISTNNVLPKTIDDNSDSIVGTTDPYYRIPATGRYRVRVKLDGFLTTLSPLRSTAFILTINRPDSDLQTRYSDLVQTPLTFPDLTFNPLKVVTLGYVQSQVGAFSFDETVELDLQVGDYLSPIIGAEVATAQPLAFSKISLVSDLIFEITNLSGETDLNPAASLQLVKQADFVKDLAIMFNLFFDVDEENKSVYIDTYNRFFENSDAALDITELVDQTSFVSKPLPQNAEYNFQYPIEDNDALQTIRDTIENTRHKETNLNQYGNGGTFFTPKTIGATEIASFQIVNDSANNFVTPTFEVAQTINCPYITTKENYAKAQNALLEIDRGFLIRIVKVKEVVSLDPTATLPFLINGAYTYYDKHVSCVFNDTSEPATYPLLWSLSFEADYGLYKQLWDKRLFEIFTGESVEFETNIRAREYNQMTLRKLIKIENQIYRLNEISDFDPIKLGTTNIILIKK